MARSIQEKKKQILCLPRAVHCRFIIILYPPQQFRNILLKYYIMYLSQKHYKHVIYLYRIKTLNKVHIQTLSFISEKLLFVINYCLLLLLYLY